MIVCGRLAMNTAAITFMLIPKASITEYGLAWPNPRSQISLIVLAVYINRSRRTAGHDRVGIPLWLGWCTCRIDILAIHRLRLCNSMLLVVGGAFHGCSLASPLFHGMSVLC